MYYEWLALINCMYHLLPPPPPPHTEKQGNRDYLLCMDYTSLDDDADYTVIAKNIVGEARSSAQLVVDEQGSDGEYNNC